MSGHSSVSLCRICLEDGATSPIFEAKENEDIHSKLCLCLGETVEDVDGYPRNLCKLCHITLNTVCNFIKKYKESCKVLERGLQTAIKQETIEIIDNEQSEFEQYELKVQPKIEFNDAEDFLELVKPFKLKSRKVKKENKSKTKKQKPKIKKEFQNKTNRIASSILEGDFVWNGETCIKTEIKKAIKKEVEVKQKQGRLKMFERLPKAAKQPSKPEPKLCDLCGEVFKDQDRLKRHMSTVHEKDKIMCPLCSKLCASNYYLKRHITRVHTVLERNFICNVCGRTFPFKGDLTTHIRNVHNKHLLAKKEYACKICNKKYACDKSVVIHERSVHTGERPAVCSVCGSSFYHEDYLKEHMRLHTGETPFKCPVCGRGYAQRGNMKSHIRIHRISELDPELIGKIRPNYLRLMKA